MLTYNQQMGDTFMDKITLAIGILALIGIIAKFINKSIENKKIKKEQFQIFEQCISQQNVMIQTAEYLNKNVKNTYEKYSEFIDAKFYLDNNYSAIIGQQSIYSKLTGAMNKLNELLTMQIKSRKNKESNTHEDIQLCIEYLQNYFDRLNEGFKNKIKNIETYCQPLSDDEHLSMIETKLALINSNN